MPHVSDEEHQALLAAVRARHAKVGKLIEVADRVCSKMEHPAASVTIFDQTDLRAALDALKSE